MGIIDRCLFSILMLNYVDKKNEWIFRYGLLYIYMWMK